MEEPNYSKAYPTQWQEGYRRGRKYYIESTPFRRMSFKCKYKDFWERLAFKNGMIDGWATEQELEVV